MIFVTIYVTTLAQRKDETKNPIVGTWKYVTQSDNNDFQKVKINVLKQDYQIELFIFESNNHFKHKFLDFEGNVVKVLEGKWKAATDKIKISYTDIDYTLNLDYFFLDKDLVLGKNFSHVIFTMDNVSDKNIALK